MDRGDVLHDSDPKRGVDNAKTKRSRWVVLGERRIKTHDLRLFPLMKMMYKRTEFQMCLNEVLSTSIY